MNPRVSNSHAFAASVVGTPRDLVELASRAFHCDPDSIRRRALRQAGKAGNRTVRHERKLRYGRADTGRPTQNCGCRPQPRIYPLNWNLT